jgi:polysaccharide export outer membrane protein
VGNIRENSPRVPRTLLVLVVGCLTVLLSACGSGTGGAIPIDQYPEEPAPGGGQYVIAPGDVLSILVFDQKDMSGDLTVRSDGRISMPLVNELDAAGKTPAQLATDLQEAMKKLILNPQVTVTVKTSSPLAISILGEVGKPGPMELPRGSGLAQAIAGAGGLSNFAHKDRLFVVRQANPKPIRIHFKYDDLTRAVGRAATFRLRSGDVIIVE